MNHQADNKTTESSELLSSMEKVEVKNGGIAQQQPEDKEKWPTKSERLSFKSKMFEAIKDNLILLFTLLAIGVGFAIGFAVRPSKPSSEAIMWLGFLGELYLRLLKLMIIPLVVSSVISGTAQLDPKCNGKISLVSFLYIMITNGVGALLGVVLLITIQPGAALQDSGQQYEAQGVVMQPQDIFADLIRNILPDNAVGATIYKVRTSYTSSNVTEEVNNGTHIFNTTVVKYTRQLVKSDGANILGLIFCSLIFGISTSLSGPKGKPFLDFFTSATEIVLRIMRWFLWYTPVGIASLIAASVAGIEDIANTFRMLGLFILCVVVGQVFIQVLMLPLIHLVIWRRNPFVLFFYTIKAWCIIFAATSTAVAMPEMFQACDRYKIDTRVSRFVVPFSVTLSANGSAVFIAASALFIGQITGYPLTAATVVIIWLLATVSSMALPSVPSSSIVAIVIILTSLNMSTSPIALLFTVEWLLDRVRSTSNGLSHVFCAATTQALSREALARADNTKQTVKYEEPAVSTESAITFM